MKGDRTSEYQELWGIANRAVDNARRSTDLNPTVRQFQDLNDGGDEDAGKILEFLKRERAEMLRQELLRDWRTKK